MHTRSPTYVPALVAILALALLLAGPGLAGGGEEQGALPWNGILRDAASCGTRYPAGSEV